MLLSPFKSPKSAETFFPFVFVALKKRMPMRSVDVVLLVWFCHRLTYLAWGRSFLYWLKFGAVRSQKLKVEMINVGNVRSRVLSDTLRASNFDPPEPHDQAYRALPMMRAKNSCGVWIISSSLICAGKALDVPVKWFEGWKKCMAVRHWHFCRRYCGVIALIDISDFAVDRFALLRLEIHRNASCQVASKSPMKSTINS